MAQGRERLDHLFEIGLVLLGILSAAEFQYYIATEKAATWLYDLKVFTLPFLALIILWIIKELFCIINKKSIVNLFLTDFCWCLWGSMLFFYLLTLVSGFIIGTFLSLVLYFIVVILVHFAYTQIPIPEQDPINLEYYRSSQGWWIFLIILLFAYFLLVVIVILPVVI
jgi:hypothetical protein